ncbi:MAG: RNA methyltransferase [Oscillospiraceae bacterium]|nr:RNA methyltransferase [Oscillospiraceae bacterium]
MERLTSRQNPTVSRMRLLGRERAFREKCGEYVCDGTKLLGEALRWGAEITAVLWSKQPDMDVPADVPQYSVPTELLDYASPLRNCPGVLFSLKMRPLPVRAGRVIVLETMQDPGNLGTVLRTANAFGMDGVILTGDCADLYNPKTVRAAMGALLRQRAESMTLEQLGEFIERNGLRLYGAALDERSVDIRDTMVDNLAVAIGSEGRGLSAELLNMCEGRVIIPMNPACESLNASVAAAIIMWELGRGS